MRAKATPSRRTFMKLGGTAALAASLSQTSAGVPLDKSEQEPNKEATGPSHGRLLTKLVNPLQGTNSTPLFSRGGTLPIVALPFGMAHWALQSSDTEGWFFQPHDNRLQGIRCTHQLSTWLGDYGNATFMPFQGEPSAEPTGRASSYRPGSLDIKPDYLQLTLMRYRCRLELAPTERCSIMRFTFEQSGKAGLFIDLPQEDSEAHWDAGSRTITALTHNNRGGVQPNFAAYYAAKLDIDVTGVEVQKLHGRQVAVVRFDTEANKPVTLRVGTSFISFDQAAQNLKQEIGSKSFDDVRSQASQIWEKALGKVRLRGGSDNQQRTFYSCLYRAQLFPRVWHEKDSSGEIVHRSPYTGQVEPGVLYADHGYWDDYHAWYPMMELLYPERLSEILQGWVNALKEGGWFPQFPCPGYRGAMTGSLIDSVFGGAAAKGLQGFDLKSAYEGLKKHATQRGDPPKGYGRVGIEPYMKLGYVPCDVVGDGVAETLDFAYGDFCIAQVARAIGNNEDADMFEKRSKNWRNIFDPQTNFFRGKLSNGSFVEPFDPYTWGGPYVEGAAWQYRFNALHDVEGLIEAMGGKEPFLKHLEEMMAQPPIFHTGTYGDEIHEMSEMAAVDFGQYAHSNQPVHNVLYMFTVAGRRDRTQYWVHRVLNELYSPDNFPGDEDTGAMSAWYILSSLGLFAVCPGKPDWTLGAPLFESATIHHDDGTLRIETQARRQGSFYNEVTLNGKSVSGPSVSHASLQKDATLLFRATS